MLKWQTSPPCHSNTKASHHSGYLSDFSYEPRKSNKKEKGYFSDSENIKFTRFSFEPRHIDYLKKHGNLQGYQVGFMVEEKQSSATEQNKLCESTDNLSKEELSLSCDAEEDTIYLDEEYKRLENGVKVLAGWIMKVTRCSVPQDLTALSELKDGQILTRFIRIILGKSYSKFKKLKKVSLHFDRKMGDINTFLRLCGKICVKREQLFTEDDWNYVTDKNYSENNMHDEEWNERLRKVLMAFFCLAGRLKETKRSQHIHNINIDALNCKEESYCRSHLDTNETTSYDRSLRTSDDSETTLRRAKKVTFHENVIKRHPSLESADNCSVNVTLYDKEEIEVFPSIHVTSEYENQMNEYKTNGYVANLLDEFPPYSYNDYNKSKVNRDEDVNYAEAHMPHISDSDSYHKRWSVQSYDLDDSCELDTQSNGDISLEKLDGESLEFLTFHSHLNADDYAPKRNFRFTLNSPRSPRTKPRDHNNNNNNSNSTGSINTTGSIKKRSREPEYWRTNDINTLERKKINKLSSNSFRKDKTLNPFSSFSRTKSAGNLSGGSFRSKLVTKFASLNLKQEPQRSSTPGPSPSSKRNFSLKRRSSFNVKIDSKPVTTASEETLDSLSASNASLEAPINFGIAARKLHENSQYHTFDTSHQYETNNSAQYNSIGKSSTFNKDSLSRKEIKDLNNLLTLFDMDKVTSSSSDEEVVTAQQEISYTSENTSQHYLYKPNKVSQQFLKGPVNSSLQKYSSNAVETLKENAFDQGKKIQDLSCNSAGYDSETNMNLDVTDHKSERDDNISNGGIPNDLSVVLNDLLSVGNANTLSEEKEEPEPFCLSRQNTLTKRSIENFFDRNNIFSEIEKFENLPSDGSRSHNSSSDSESCFEIDDSGIDETMPGLTRDYDEEKKTDRHKHRHDNENSKSKRKSEHGHRRKKHHGERKHRKDRSEKEEGTSRRSHSEPRKNNKRESNERSDSVPRSSAYSTKSDEKERKEHKERGRQREKRSEPPVPARPSNYTKSKRSEPIVTNKVVKKNDIEGGAVGVYKRTQTEPTSSNRVVSSKNVKLSVKTNGELNTTSNIKVKRNNSVQLSPKAREYMWDTADGKHRVYVRSKEEKDRSPPKQMNGSVNNKSKSQDIADELGLSPELMDMLKEEEKFWQKQQELKYWRELRDQAEDNEYNSKKIPRGRENSFEKRERLREIEENRLEREASLLMRVRAEQEYVLQTSRENLLNDNHETNHYSYHDNTGKQYERQSYDPFTDVTDAMYSRPNHNGYYDDRDYVYNEPLNRHTDVLRNNYPRRDMIASSGYKSSNTASPRDFEENSYSATSPRYPIYQNGYSSATTEISRRSSNEPPYSKYILQSGCFSDDDEVFYSRRENKREDNRGYYSDHDSQLIGRTYNARPMINSQRLHIICTACSRVVSDERLMTSEVPHYFWHLKCFFCVVCRAFLNDNHAVRVRIVDHKLHCRYCFSAQNGEQLSEV